MTVVGYAFEEAWASIRRAGRSAAVSIGTNPHYGGTERRIEPYLLDFDGDLYGMDIEVEFLRFVRGEKKFDSLDDLRAQIERDIAEVRM